MGLRDLRKFDFLKPSVALWNEMVEEVAKRLPKRVDLQGRGGGAFPHPFEVRVERWRQDLQEFGPDGRNADLRDWRVNVRAGCVNDEAVTIGYWRKGDPREWKMPEDYPALKPGEPGYHPDFVERPLYERESEAGRADAPFLLLESPVTGRESAQWELLSFEERLEYFRTEKMMEKEVWRASVVVTGSPRVAGIFFPELPTKLQRFRVFAGRKPNRTIAGAGGLIEIAQVFLLRDKEEPDPENDQVEVRQLVFWSLGNIVVQSAVNLPGARTFEGGLLTDLAQAELDRLSAETAMVEWWSQ